MTPEEGRIFAVVKANTLKVLFDLDPAQVTVEKSLADLGANSIDRVEIAMSSIEDLALQVPLAALRGIGNLRSLVELLHRYSAS